MKLSSGKNSGVLLLTALVAALLFAVYYYVVLPKQDEVTSLTNSVNSLESEITLLNEQVTDTGESVNWSDEFRLRKKVPSNRAIDELILNIEEIEYITQSRILSINFNNYDSLVSESQLVPTPEEENTLTETEQALEGEEATEEGPISSIAIDSLPPSLKMITVQIEVESPKYEMLEKFIKEMENLDRIMHIDSIGYSLQGEELEFEGTSEVVAASIQFTTFYYEGNE